MKAFKSQPFWLSRTAKGLFFVTLYLSLCTLGMFIMPPSDRPREMLTQLFCIILASGLLTLLFMWIANWKIWGMKFKVYWYNVDAKVYLTDREALQAASQEMGRRMNENSAVLLDVSRGYDRKMKKPYVELVTRYTEIRSKRYYFVTFK